MLEPQGGTLEAFKVVLLKQYEGAAGTFRGLVDETHFYQLVTDDAATAHWDTLPMGIGDIGPRVLKFNRFSGELETASDTITIPTHAYNEDGSLVALDSPAVDLSGLETRFELPQWTSRGPLAMSEDAIFVPHTTGNLLMKLSKSDLKPVWTFKAPHWLSIGEMQRQSGDEVNSGAYGDSPA